MSSMNTVDTYLRSVAVKKLNSIIPPHWRGLPNLAVGRLRLRDYPEKQSLLLLCIRIHSTRISMTRRVTLVLFTSRLAFRMIRMCPGEGPLRRLGSKHHRDQSICML